MLRVRQYNGYIERIDWVSGGCPRVDDDVETILLCISDLVQDQVARAHVAWPWADDGGFMSVALVDGFAMWVRTSDSRPIAHIGRLCEDCTEPW